MFIIWDKNFLFFIRNITRRISFRSRYKTFANTISLNQVDNNGKNSLTTFQYINKSKIHAEDCGGSGICKHRKNKARCKDCGGSAFCEHGKRKERCKDCGGSDTISQLVFLIVEINCTF